MHLIYTHNGDVVAGVAGQCRHAGYFDKAELSATLVYTDESNPNVRMDYEAAGVVVHSLRPSEKFDIDKLKVDEIKALLIEANVAFPHDAKKQDLISLYHKQVNHEPS